MLLTRDDLCKIYIYLHNNQKNLWARKAGYSSTQSLYNYLKRNDTVASEEVMDALISALGGEENFKILSKKVLHVDLDKAVLHNENSNSLNMDNMNEICKVNAYLLNFLRNISNEYSLDDKLLEELSETVRISEALKHYLEYRKIISK